MELELKTSPAALFLTLTYNDKKLPEYYDSLGSLVKGNLEPNDTELFLHRLRKKIKRSKKFKDGAEMFRYYLVGEYGEKSDRPHYHAAIFGLACTGSNPSFYKGKRCECDTCSILQDAWSINGDPIGHIGVGTLERDSISYVVGYLQKTAVIDGTTIMGLTNENDEKVKQWLDGRHPEFRRQSQGIGRTTVVSIAETLRDHLRPGEDVPGRITLDGTTYNLGRYLRNKVRKELGFKDQNETKNKVRKMLYPERTFSPNYAPTEALLQLSEEIQEQKELVFDKAREIGKDKYHYEKQVREQKVKNLEVKVRIHHQGRTIL
jgi:hypothetical protein